MLFDVVVCQDDPYPLTCTNEKFDGFTCSFYAAINGLCAAPWNEIYIGDPIPGNYFCDGSTPGRIMDTCRLSCGDCTGN